MAIRDIFKVSRKTFFNPTAWIGTESISAQNNVLWGVIKNITTAPAPATGESFEEAVKRQGLTEKDIHDGMLSYRALAVVFSLLGLGSFIYGVYLVFHFVSIAGFILAFSVSALFFAQAFRYDFWSLQMRRRHLGLTFADWKSQYLRN
jgi:hypothetical protein